MFLGISADAWAAIGSNTQALVTTILIGIGAWQVFAIKRENLKSRTLSACDRYDTDPIIDASLRELRLLLRDPESAEKGLLKLPTTTILNYLDSIAVGVEQGLYIESLARDHLKAIVIKHTDDYLRDESVARKIGLNPANFTTLTAMASRWKADPLTFRDGWKWRKI